MNSINPRKICARCGMYGTRNEQRVIYRGGRYVHNNLERCIVALQRRIKALERGQLTQYE